MSAPRQRVYTYRGAVPLWLVLAIIAPLGLVFFTSLLLALGIAGMLALAAGALPLFRKHPGGRGGDTIELDPSQYRLLGSTPPRDER